MKTVGMFFLVAVLAVLNGAGAEKPNVVLIFADDLGYGDLSCYGGKVPTPNLDRLAQEGARFTDFYVSQPVCSASRAALMTGRWANRVGIYGALGPRSTNVLSTNELTMAEVLKGRGYTNAIYGKWHLGDRPGTLPRSHGFDDYYGLPYSNDMWPHHPVNPDRYPPLPLIENERVMETMPDQRQLTKAYTERAVRFMKNSKGQPFFVYVAHSMPHVPLFVSEAFQGKSAAGLYGDVLAELDWSVGEVLKALKETGADDKTLVMFTSDNGPWLLYGNHAGSAGPLREGKMTAFEGGFRVPFLARWPGKIPAGTVSREIATTMDVLPTVARLAGAKMPENVRLDGKDIWPLLSGRPNAKSPHAAFPFYINRELHAVRSGKWKLHFPHSYHRPEPPGGEGQPGKARTLQTGLELYDLETDVGETTSVAEENPTVVERLQGLAEEARREFGDALAKRQASGTATN